MSLLTSITRKHTVHTTLPVFFSTSISPPLNWDPLIKAGRERPSLAFPSAEKAVKFSKRSQSQSKVCQELSSLGGCSRSPTGGTGCIIQTSLDPGKENRNQTARARGGSSSVTPAPGAPHLQGSRAALAPAEVLRPAQEELAPGGGNSKPVASGSRTKP